MEKTMETTSSNNVDRSNLPSESTAMAAPRVNGTMPVEKVARSGDVSRAQPTSLQSLTVDRRCTDIP